MFISFLRRKSTPPTDAIIDHLRSVANGDLTLMPSPQEALRASELELGRPLIKDEKRV
jgi:hypothetical protein